MKNVVVLLAMAMAVSSAAAVDLYLYDDFNNAAVSATLWTVEDTPATPVTFDGAKAILNMQEPSDPGSYMSRIIAKIDPGLNAAGDEFRFTFDMQQNDQVFASSGWVDGFAVGRDNSQMWYGGQYSLGPGDSRVGTVWNSKHGGDSVDRMYADLHYDCYMAVDRVSGTQAVLTLGFDAYTRVPAYDTDPEQYVANETALYSRLTPGNWLNYQVNVTDNTLRFCVNRFFGADSPGHLRGENFIDNVYTSIPEPGTMTLLVLGGLGFIRRRK